MSLEQNKNTNETSFLINQFANLGVKFACIASGSRSTPLTIAIATNPKLKSYTFIDERGAGFFALGLALISKTPVILVCTSGTALSNFYPAVLEAFYSGIPLIVLSADRPFYLKNFGANQTMDQTKFFGTHVKEFVEIPPPENLSNSDQKNYLKSIAARVYSKSVFSPQGPVHINLQFGKPLEPKINNSSEIKLSTLDDKLIHVYQGHKSPTIEQINILINLIQNKSKGLIICGPRIPGIPFFSLLTNLSNLIGYPILADPSSGLRFGVHNEHENLILTSYETFLKKIDLDVFKPEVMIQLGDLPVSTNLQNFLVNLKDITIVTITDGIKWNDQSHNSDIVIECDAQILIDDLYKEIKKIKNKEINREWVKNWTSKESKTWGIITKSLNKSAFEGSLINRIFQNLLDGSNISVANSLSIRNVDQFVNKTPKRINLFSNRGLSGIDGTISTALGIASQTTSKLVLITGDLAFYHDLNSLILINKYKIKIVIILVNNNGGGIFERLPIASYGKLYKEFFTLSHDLDFKKLHQFYASDLFLYDEIKTLEEVDKKLTDYLTDEKSYLIELKTDFKETNNIINSLYSQLE